MIRKFKRYPLTFSIIFLNVLVYLITLTFSGRLTLEQGLSLYISGSRQFNIHEIFSIFLSGFTHFNFLHIFFNMLFLYYVGPLVELLLKRKYYLLLYLGSLFFSGLFVVYFSSPVVITIGASGALYGILGFLITYYYLNKKLLEHVIKINELLILVGINVLFTLFDKNISILGHFSGFFIGIILTFIIDYLQKRSRREYGI